MHYGDDDMYKNSGFQSEGLVLANYELHEKPSQKYSGVFKGVMTLYWYVDKDGIIKYDDIGSSYQDGYNNNEYIGTWTLYGRKTGKVANWGEYRIPFSGDLDIGASEFYANRKYESRGWEDYIDKDDARAHATPEQQACIFSSNTPDCKKLLLCKGTIKQMVQNNPPPSLLIFPYNFSIVLNNTEDGNECAQSLSFKIFDVTLNNPSMDVEYMKNSSIALSYSMEKNPASFLKQIPGDLLTNRDVLASLCCSFHDKYIKNSEYRRKHLKQRLLMLSKVKRPELMSRKIIVESVIRENLKSVGNFSGKFN